ncbi:MAG: S8 family serine peptidase, partial [Acidimicrobiales bacterium]
MRLVRPVRRARAGLLGGVLVVAGALIVAAPGPVAARPVGPGAGIRPVIDPSVMAGAVDVPVVVQARPGRAGEAARTATKAGGTVGQPLAIIDGFAARLSGASLAALAGSPDVVAVTLDRSGTFTSAERRDGGSSDSPYTQVTGATGAWTSGLRGQGVTVAVLDTGISPMADVASRTVHGPDLSGEGTLIDSYGHGTVMAGIIGGDGADSGGRRSGVAPEAGLVAVKVAGRNGAVDVTTVLQGLAWVAAYRQELGIRVLNLSYGTRSTQDPRLDPLNFAVQRLWAQGIVVVVAAGNGGADQGTITKPGDDPVVLTVGAYDDRGDTAPHNDVVPAWSSQGPTAQGVAKPDIVAPGRTLVATRSYGSAVEQDNPDALVPSSYIKGSGTSEATAVTSGLVALLLQAHPTWTPDQVKQALTSTAAPLANTSRNASGHGRAQLRNALNADPGAPVRQPLTATGLGSVEESRGGDHIKAACGVIEGEVDAMCQPWDAEAWTGGTWTGGTW